MGSYSGETDRKEMEIESNEKIANQNLKFQKEKLQYDMDLQQQIFQREDTAYQRTVDDMRKAGISPLAMQGTNSAGEAVATVAPHNDMRYDYMSGMTTDAERLNTIMNGITNITNVLKTQQEAQSLKLQNEYMRDTLEDRKNLQHSQAILAKYNALSAREKQYFNNFYHITDSMPPEQKLAHISATLASNSGKKTGKSLKDFESGLTSFNDFSDYGTFDELLSDVFGQHGKSPIEAIANSEKKDVYGKSSSDYDKEYERLLKKQERGEELSFKEKAFVKYWSILKKAGSYFGGE